MVQIALALILHPTLSAVLVARRRKGAHLAEFWEFPGGKIELGETARQCAVREAKEETGLHVETCDRILESVVYEYPERSVTLTPVLCRALSEDAQALASDEVRWVRSSELEMIEFPPANAPIITQLKAVLAALHEPTLQPLPKREGASEFPPASEGQE